MVGTSNKSVPEMAIDYFYMPAYQMVPFTNNSDTLW